MDLTKLNGNKRKIAKYVVDHFENTGRGCTSHDLEEALPEIRSIAAYLSDLEFDDCVLVRSGTASASLGTVERNLAIYVPRKASDVHTVTQGRAKEVRIVTKIISSFALSPQKALNMVEASNNSVRDYERDLKIVADAKEAKAQEIAPRF